MKFDKFLTAVCFLFVYNVFICYKLFYFFGDDYVDVEDHHHQQQLIADVFACRNPYDNNSSNNKFMVEFHLSFKNPILHTTTTKESSSTTT